MNRSIFEKYGIVFCLIWIYGIGFTTGMLCKNTSLINGICIFIIVTMCWFKLIHYHYKKERGDN